MTKKIVETNFNEVMQTPMLDKERAMQIIANIEDNVRTLKQLVGLEGYESTSSNIPSYSSPANELEEGGEHVEGIFDGERMIDSNGKTYQVSANYASKSKLIEGDPLKLYITPDGKYFFKQIGPIERKTIPAILRMEGSHYVLEAEDGNVYSVLTASVTYYVSLYHLQPGDKVMITVPADKAARWAVIDNVI